MELNKITFTNIILDNLNNSISENGKVDLEHFINLTNKTYEAINYTRCSLQLPTKEDYIFWNAPENAKKEGKLNDLSWIDSEEDGIHDLFEEFMEYWKNKAIV